MRAVIVTLAEEHSNLVTNVFFKLAQTLVPKEREN